MCCITDKSFPWVTRTHSQSHHSRKPEAFHCTLPSPSSESKEIERARGYQFTVTHMPNSIVFGGGNVSASFQWLYMGWNLSFHLSFMSYVELNGTILYTFCLVILLRCLTLSTCWCYYCIYPSHAFQLITYNIVELLNYKQIKLSCRLKCTWNIICVYIVIYIIVI